MRLPYAYSTEVVQLLFAAGALVYLAWAVWVSYRIDRSRRRLGQDGALGNISTANLLRAGFRVLKALMFLAIGIVSVLRPPPYPVYEPIDVIINSDLADGIASVRWLIMAATVLLLLDSIVERWFYTTRLEMIAKLRDHASSARRRD